MQMAAPWLKPKEGVSLGPNCLEPPGEKEKGITLKREREKLKRRGITRLTRKGRKPLPRRPYCSPFPFFVSALIIGLLLGRGSVARRVPKAEPSPRSKLHGVFSLYFVLLKTLDLSFKTVETPRQASIFHFLFQPLRPVTGGYVAGRVPKA